MITTEKQIIRQLKRKLKAKEIAIEDQSRWHQSHSEAIKSGGGHFAILVIASCFRNKTPLQRHRMIYAAIKDIHRDIHALSIRAMTPTEQRKLSKQSSES
jgi:BolA protein